VEWNWRTDWTALDLGLIRNGTRTDHTDGSIHRILCRWAKASHGGGPEPQALVRIDGLETERMYIDGIAE